MDDKPLSENEVDDRLKRALDVLGTAPGATKDAHVIITAARKALWMYSIGLIEAGVKRERQRDSATPEQPD
ncbi:MAG TPA: hypothetical protein VN004_21070 [Pseudorhodoplanes sp.]|nr:hypothetical protein [Pseudorhodoplanes sp.]